MEGGGTVKDDEDTQSLDDSGSSTSSTKAWRARAEELVRDRFVASRNWEQLTPEQSRQMLYELQVHQIELEMQNDELRRTQAALDLAKSRYFDLYDLAPVGYLTLSDGGTILEANLTAATMLGVERSSLVRRAITQLILPADQDIFYHCRRQLFETGLAQSCELRIRRADRSEFWAHLDSTVARDESGALLCRLAMSDISKCRLAEDEAEEANAVLHAAMDQISLGIVIADVPGGNIRYVNEAGLRMAGLDREASVNHRCLEDYAQLWHVHDLDGTPLKTEDLPLARTLRSGEQSEREIVLRRRENDERIVWARAAPVLNAAGPVALAVAVFLDITERKRAEKAYQNLQGQLVHAQKMEAVGQLAGGIAHDFNNILAAIIMQLGMLRIHPDIPSDALIQTVDEVLASASRAAALTRQLLIFSRRQAMSIPRAARS
jgi:PAS domain S-box-containing protein